MSSSAKTRVALSAPVDLHRSRYNQVYAYMFSVLVVIRVLDLESVALVML